MIIGTAAQGQVWVPIKANGELRRRIDTQATVRRLDYMGRGV